jgi:hypothetical protein
MGPLTAGLTFEEREKSHNHYENMGTLLILGIQIAS